MELPSVSWKCMNGTITKMHWPLFKLYLFQDVSLLSVPPNLATQIGFTKTHNTQ